MAVWKEREREMKRRVITLLLLAFTSVVLVACKGKENTPPTLSGVANTSTPHGVEFDPLAGVQAYDEEDGDLTNDIVVTGEVNHFLAGTYELKYKVEDLVAFDFITYSLPILSMGMPTQRLLVFPHLTHLQTYCTRLIPHHLAYEFLQ